MFENGFPKHWSTLKKLIWLVGSGIAGGASAVEKTVSGAIVHILDALAKPAISLKCEINPLQDLHGYDNPWPAGGGKNILNPHFYSGGAYNPTVGDTWTLTDSSVQPTANADNSVFTFTTSATWRYYTLLIPVVRGTNYKLTGSISSTDHLGVSFGYLNDEFKVIQVSTNSTATSQTWNYSPAPSAAGTAAYYFIVITNRDTASATITITKPQFEVGSTATAYAPYSNECPITGFTGLTVSQTGEDFYKFDGTTGTSSSSKVTKLADDSIKVERNGSTNYPSSKQLLSEYDLVIGKTYYISADAEITTGSARIGIRDSNNGSLALSENITENGRLYLIFTLTSEMNFLSFFAAYGQSTGNVTYKNIRFCEVSTIPISWQTEAGTVYGGTDEIVSGELSSTMKMVDLGDLNYTRSPSGLFVYTKFNDSARSLTNGNIGDALSDIYTFMASTPISGTNPDYYFHFAIAMNGTLYISDPRYTDTAEFKTAMAGHKVVYLLATPVTYQLDPVTVNLLLGENNLWHDANGNTELTYYADGNASTSEALGILLGGAYHNPGGDDDATDEEALGILLGS